MKRKLNLLWLFMWLFATGTFAQLVPSSCDGTEHIKQYYRKDAFILTLNRVLKHQNSYKDTVVLPSILTDTCLKALLAVANSGLKAADTVINIYEIHRRFNPPSGGFSIGADSTLPWMINIRNNIFPTGQPLLDSILTLYPFRKIYYIAFKTAGYHAVGYSTDSNYNCYPIAKLLNRLPGVENAEVNGHQYGDGNNIQDSVYNNHVELIYSVGWGDCPSGCINRRFWKFNVYFDCTVEYMGSYGDKLPVTALQELKSEMPAAYPNPFTSNIYLDNVKSEASYEILNSLGQSILTGKVTEEGITGLDPLTPGYYLLLIQDGEAQIRLKILKR